MERRESTGVTGMRNHKHYSSAREHVGTETPGREREKKNRNTRKRKGKKDKNMREMENKKTRNSVQCLLSIYCVLHDLRGDSSNYKE